MGKERERAIGAAEDRNLRLYGWPHEAMGFSGGTSGKRTCLPMQEMREMCVQSLDQEDPLEEMATHSSVLAWRILWTEEPGGLQSMGSQRIRHDWATNTFTFSSERFLPWTQSEGGILVNGVCIC